MLLKDKVIVVTGGAGLLGQEFIRVIVEHGGVAIIADVNENYAQEVCSVIQSQLNSDNIISVKLDITSEKSIHNLIQKVDVKFGKIDALVNNAYPRNKNYGKHFFDVKYSDFVENLGLNLGGYFVTSKLFSKYFQTQGFGNIVNISSIYGIMAPKFEIYGNTSMTTPVEYAAIKSGLIGLTRYMAKYFKGMDIRVNAISPGGILDGQPGEFLEKYNDECLGKGMLDREDVSGTLVFLLSDMSTYINGKNIIVDDGFSV